MNFRVRLFILRAVVLAAFDGELDAVDELDVGAFVDFGRVAGREVGNEEPQRAAGR